MNDRVVSYLIKFTDRFSPVMQKMQTEINKSMHSASRMQAKVNVIPNSIDALRQRLDRLTTSRDSAFREDHIRRYNGLIRQTQNELHRLENLPPRGFISRLTNVNGRLQSIAKAAVAAFTVRAIAGFGSQIVMATGQVEQYKLTLENMLGSKALADERMNEYTKIAAKTPFEIQDVVALGNGLQALGRYSKSNVLLLGDLAAAAGKPLDQVKMAYSKLATGQKGEAVNLFRDLLISTDDWVKATGKGVTKNGELLATNEEMLAVLPRIMKDKGFFGMMDRQSQGILGKISNLKDTLFQTFVQIGDAMRPVIDWVINALGKVASGFQGMVTWITRNKEVIGALSKVVLTASVFFGGLKLTILAVRNATMLARLAQGAYAAIVGLTTKNVGLMTTAMRIFGVTSKAALIGSGIGILITLVASAASAFYLFKTRTDESADAIKRAGLMARESYAQEKVGLDVLFRAMEKTNPATKERAEIVKRLKEQYPELNAELEKELLTTNNLAGAYDVLNKKILKKAQMEAMEEVTKEHAKKQVANLQRIEELNAELAQKKKEAALRKSIGVQSSSTIAGTGGMGETTDLLAIKRREAEIERLKAENTATDAKMQRLANQLAEGMVEEIKGENVPASATTTNNAAEAFQSYQGPVNPNYVQPYGWTEKPGYTAATPATETSSTEPGNQPTIDPSKIVQDINPTGTGAARVTNVNINLGTLVNSITLNVAQAKEGADEIRTILMTELKQLLNSANKLAPQ